MKLALAAVLVAASAAPAAAQARTDADVLYQASVPPDLEERATQAGILADHPIDFSLNPT